MSGQVTIGTPAATASRHEFHPQWVMKAPTAAWPRMRFCGAHPVISIPRLSLPPAVTFSRSPPPVGSSAPI
ncbi:unnamed protein product [Spirodela intermedia]|uniref:Uncharacterized protein n=1 Tax=Spirodela intermedia TaxID=51605 RepID=A0A7I8IP52_SPIIN|nr:unnamed protein product [Spirodela intermedia]CAA6658780.1 unnamed protein product [Spirodela intermedia]